jgi:hypothetical protein
METKNIFKALAEFQQKVPVIFKDSQAYGYKYADLPAIFEVINPIMQECGLGFTQIINGASLKTIVFHIESGEQIESNIDIPQGVDLKGMNTFQILGSAITYLRRYAISSMLGLVTDKDTDAQGEQVKPQPKQEPKPAEKEYMSTDHVKYDAAKQAVIDGKTNVLEIQKKYVLSPEAKKELTNITLNK